MKVWNPPVSSCNARSLQQVIDTILIILHVAVEHGRVRAQSQLVGDARRVQPFAAVNLVVADDVANAVGKNLSPAARQRINTGCLHLDEGLLNGELRTLRQKRHFHHCECLDVNLREALLQSRNEVEEVFERQIRVQSADDVELRDRLSVAGGRGLPCLLQGHCVGALASLLAAEGAETAGSNTDIGRIDMPIDVEVGQVAVHLLAHPVRQPSHGEQIARLV